ncbi:hypothetical protein KV205_24380 [Streptomyces sp. SKN60]|uniref:hypothetical protein n=1 Tax=Streptomyces sp. SKN60 TaxID=2855506 RepID=UPI002246771F|nr:hypothetical protein [Streptomyces sp. SKN60]MCX2183641.1 hypothetical protein [Streptomyces sp. SKN60]
MTRDVDDELRARLREAAGAHRPDRARILARVERGMAGPAGAERGARRRPAAGRLRLAGVTAAVAGVLAVGGFAVAAAVKEEVPTPPQGTVSMPPAPSSPKETDRPPVVPTGPTPGATDGRTDAPKQPDRTTAAPPTTTPLPGGDSSASAPPPGGTSGVADGPLWSDGSVDPHSNAYWAQSNITLKTTAELSALTVRLRVAQTGGVASTGAWRSLPEQDFALTVEERDGFLVYTWVLKRGRTVPAGEWVFAGQYDHRSGGRDATDDRYTVTATTSAGAERPSVSGDFGPHGDN